MERHTKSYIQLAKPGITISNSFAAFAGAMFGVSVLTTGAAIQSGIGVVVGVALLIMSACVVNNITDRSIDARMKRTKKRALLTGDVPRLNALLYALVLGIMSVVVLWFYTNPITLALGGIAFIWYTLVYAVAKRTTALSTLVGTVPGSLPAVAGYTAITGRLDEAALVLFVAMTAWQLGHFYAISIFRRREYAAAGVPVWAVRYGVLSTIAQIRIAQILFLVSAPLLALHGAGYMYALGVVALALWWIQLSRRVPDDGELWAKKVFGGSLVVLLVWLLLVAVGGFLP